MSSEGSLEGKPVAEAPKASTDAQHLEQIRTAERVPGHTNYYEKDGVRTYGDGMDHDHEPPMTFKRFMSLAAMGFLWTGSQIPVYLYGGIPPYIYADIGGHDRWTWFVLGYLLALAAICPFVGSLSDLLGRRYVALMGGVILILGMIICGTAHDMNTFICGMVFAGIGAGINELTALAATSEMAPTRKRGTYVAVLIFTIIPFCPSVLYGQLIAYYSTWRYIALFCGLWEFIGVVFTAFFYFPPPRSNSTGMTRREVLAQIDYVGGLLSIAGMLLFMMALQWGGYQYDWDSAHVLAPLILGVALIIAFFCWEVWGAKYPMFPKRLNQNKRVLALTLLITAISGANFFSVLLFWPTQAFNVYGHDPVEVGIKGLPIGFAILFGGCIVLVLLSALKGQIRLLMVVSTVIMTAGTGSLAIADYNNMGTVWGLLVLAGLGIGGILVPASIITTIICPDDLIATVSAITLSIRVIGGSIGYAVYYNVFLNKFVPLATTNIGYVMIYKLGIRSPAIIGEVVELTGASLLEEIEHIPEVHAIPGAYEAIVLAGQMAFADAYKWVYYMSIIFGGLSIIAACFLGDISKYMDDHVAVDIH
ncbi:MFS multidrug transporter-like protein [Aulographum hederae CBS 113979]|uniref:MFS multidrug transporter-like protein n=1 Tax=Aulographum hederae CBS 113979 TaxID=1176131 RepID=A0A6G1HEK1_9PEZI|nr:MFS multidrug transporter-like protein [Aulographum hederae CBS 113979]